MMNCSHLTFSKEEHKSHRLWDVGRLKKKQKKNNNILTLTQPFVILTSVSLEKSCSLGVRGRHTSHRFVHSVVCKLVELAST